MASPWKLTARLRSRLYRVARLRNLIPTDAELAQELGISVRAVQWHLSKWKLRYCVDILQPRPRQPGKRGRRVAPDVAAEPKSD